MKQILSLLLVLLANQAQAKCGDYPFNSVAYKDGKRVGLYITADELNRDKPWSPDWGEPPLSMSQAVSIALDWAGDFYPNYDSIAINYFTLSRSRCQQAEDRWVYSFSLSPVVDGNVVIGKIHLAAVTMSGRVIEPRDVPN